MFPALPVDLQSLQSVVLGSKATYQKKKIKRLHFGKSISFLACEI